MKRTANRVLALASLMATVTACGATSATSPSGSAVDAAGLQRATALATTYLAPSNSLNLSVPLNTAPPANKKVVYLQMGNVGDVVVYTSGLVAAAKAVHWQLKTIVYDLTNPQAVNSAVQEAVNLNPDYITISAAQVSLFQAALTNAKAKGIPVFELIRERGPAGCHQRHLLAGGRQRAVQALWPDRC